MPFADDLLEQAYDLAHKEAANPKQASLRRAVSTAYYALFHFLIDEAVTKWAIERQRTTLARTFDHGKMKAICDDVLKGARSGANVLPELHAVAHNFIQLQQHRHTADYDNSKQWSRADVLNVLTLATDAFTAWRAISNRCGSGLSAAIIPAETSQAVEVSTCVSAFGQERSGQSMANGRSILSSAISKVRWLPPAGAGAN